MPTSTFGLLHSVRIAHIALPCTRRIHQAKNTHTLAEENAGLPWDWSPSLLILSQKYSECSEV